MRIGSGGCASLPPPPAGSTGRRTRHCRNGSSSSSSSSSPPSRFPQQHIPFLSLGVVLPLLLLLLSAETAPSAAGQEVVPVPGGDFSFDIHCAVPQGASPSDACASPTSHHILLATEGGVQAWERDTTPTAATPLSLRGTPLPDVISSGGMGLGPAHAAKVTCASVSGECYLEILRTSGEFYEASLSGLRAGGTGASVGTTPPTALWNPAGIARRETLSGVTDLHASAGGNVSYALSTPSDGAHAMSYHPGLLDSGLTPPAQARREYIATTKSGAPYRGADGACSRVSGFSSSLFWACGVNGVLRSLGPVGTAASYMWTGGGWFREGEFHRDSPEGADNCTHVSCSPSGMCAVANRGVVQLFDGRSESAKFAPTQLLSSYDTTRGGTSSETLTDLRLEAAPGGDTPAWLSYTTSGGSVHILSLQHPTRLSHHASLPCTPGCAFDGAVIAGVWVYAKSKTLASGERSLRVLDLPPQAPAPPAFPPGGLGVAVGSVTRGQWLGESPSVQVRAFRGMQSFRGSLYVAGLGLLRFNSSSGEDTSPLVEQHDVVALRQEVSIQVVEHAGLWYVAATEHQSLRIFKISEGGSGGSLELVGGFKAGDAFGGDFIIKGVSFVDGTAYVFGRETDLLLENFCVAENVFTTSGIGSCAGFTADTASRSVVYNKLDVTSVSSGNYIFFLCHRMDRLTGDPGFFQYDVSRPTRPPTEVPTFRAYNGGVCHAGLCVFWSEFAVDVWDGTFVGAYSMSQRLKSFNEEEFGGVTLVGASFDVDDMEPAYFAVVTVERVYLVAVDGLDVVYTSAHRSETQLGVTLAGGMMWRAFSIGALEMHVERLEVVTYNSTAAPPTVVPAGRTATPTVAPQTDAPETDAPTPVPTPAPDTPAPDTLAPATPAPPLTELAGYVPTAAAEAATAALQDEETEVLLVSTFTTTGYSLGVTRTPGVLPLQQLALDNANGMSKTFQWYVEYWGFPEFADVYVTDALNARGVFTRADIRTRVAAFHSGVLLQSIWMSVVKQAERAAHVCNISTSTPDVYLDTAWSYYAGSLEGVRPRDAVHIKALVREMGTNFADPSGVLRRDAVDSRILSLFKQAQTQMLRGDCDAMRVTVDSIVAALTVPVLQGIVHHTQKVLKSRSTRRDADTQAADTSAQKVLDSRSTHRILHHTQAADTSDGLQHRAHAWSYATAVMPLVRRCSSAASDTLRLQLSFDSAEPVRDGITSVLEALESVYDCLGVQCGDVGGHVQPDGTFTDGMSPCKPTLPTLAPFEATLALRLSHTDLDAGHVRHAGLTFRVLIEGARVGVSDGPVGVAVRWEGGEVLQQGGVSCGAFPCVVLHTDVDPHTSTKGIAATALRNPTFVRAEISTINAALAEVHILLQDDSFRLVTPQREMLHVSLAMDILDRSSHADACRASSMRCRCGTPAPTCYTPPALLAGEQPHAPLLSLTQARSAAALAVLATGAVMPASAPTGSALIRLSLVTRIAVCPDDGDDEEDIDPTLNPLLLRLGDTNAISNGTAAGNAAIILGLALLCCAALLAMSLLRSNSAEPNTANPLLHLMARARFGWLVVPGSFLYGAAVEAGASTLLYSSNPYRVLGFVDLLLGILATLCCAWALRSIPLHMTYGTPADDGGASPPPGLPCDASRCPGDGGGGGGGGAGGTPPEDPKGVGAPDKHPRGLSLLTRALKHALLGAPGAPEWAAHGRTPDSAAWYEVYGMLFDGYTLNARYYMVIEQGVTVLLAGLSAWEPSGGVGCEAQNVAGAGILAGMALLLCFMRPYIAPYETAFDVVAAVCEAAMLCCAATALRTNDPLSHWSPSATAVLAQAALGLIMSKFAIDTALFVFSQHASWRDTPKHMPFIVYLFCGCFGRSTSGPEDAGEAEKGCAAPQQQEEDQQTQGDGSDVEAVGKGVGAEVEAVGAWAEPGGVLRSTSPAGGVALNPLPQEHAGEWVCGGGGGGQEEAAGGHGRSAVYLWSPSSSDDEAGCGGGAMPGSVSAPTPGAGKA